MHYREGQATPMIGNGTFTLQLGYIQTDRQTDRQINLFDQIEKIQ